MTPNHAVPDPTERAALNDRLRTTGQDSGFWDELGRPAPWPTDIDEWRPTTGGNSITLQPGEPPF